MRQLGQDSITELVARTREREGRVRVQALETAAARGAADAGVELRPECPLFGVGVAQAARELLDAADPEAPPAAEAGTVADAAFHVYARGATDYRP